MKTRVLVGLSGGVDSAVTAALLLKEGYEVFGCWLDIGLGGRREAEKVAAHLGIPLLVGDIREELEREVCAPFAAEYLAGRTPSPCALCNPKVKFPALLRAAQEVGADVIATGHYARIRRDEEGELGLYRGREKNDQVYMLAGLPKAFLPSILFPLGDLEKKQVRQLARDFGLPVADKPDSMEICFVPQGDYAAWIETRGQVPPPGDFVDREGKVLGTHRGIHHYTVGQRRGLGLSAAARLYVSEIRPATNQVVLSWGDQLQAGTVTCESLNLYSPISQGQEVLLRLRHSKIAYPATISLEEGRARFLLKDPARAPTPGQLAVFYAGDRVLGSGWIVKEA